MDSVDIVHGLSGHCPWTEWTLSMDTVHGLGVHCPWTQWTLSMDPRSNTPDRQCPLSPWTFYRWVFLHPDNHLRKVDASSCKGGERMPNFPYPLKTKDCMHIHDRVRMVLSLVRVGKEWASHIFLHPHNLASAQD